MFDKGGGEIPNGPEHGKHKSHSHINYQEWNMKKVCLTLMLWSDFSHFLTHFSLAAVFGFFVFVHFCTSLVSMITIFFSCGVFLLNLF